MTGKPKKDDRPDIDHSKKWVVELVPSLDRQDNLDKVIDLVLQAENRGAKPNMGGSGSPSPGDT